MQEPTNPSADAVEDQLSAAEDARDEDRLRTLEELRGELESALAEGDGDQAGPPGR